MNFISATYLLFLLMTFIVYWKLGSRTRQNILLAVGSYIFYAWWDWRFCALMLTSTLIDFWCAQKIDESEGSERKSYLFVSLAANLCLLAFFKYFHFFQDSLVGAAQSLGMPLEPLTLSIILPVGISFYTFQTISYSIDVYRGDLKPTHSLIDYVVYVSFFPQLVAGPIERGARMLPQVTSPRTYNHHEVMKGLQQIVWGFFKKTAIASNVAPLVNDIFSDIPSHSGIEIWFGAFCFAIQIYCDFSGYSDIAIGSARLFGIRLMQNFRCPYFSQSIREFWRRWHISLSTWFRDYVFIPLGGSRGTRFRTNFNLFLVFVVSGLWHGASWNFVIWGAIHGIVLIIENFFATKNRSHSTQMPGGEKLIPELSTVVRMIAVCSIVLVAWVFFRVPDLHDALACVTKMFSDFRLPDFSGSELASIAISGILLPCGLLLIEWFSRRHEVPFFGLYKTSPAVTYLACTICIWVTFLLKPESIGEFIYFQF